MSLIPSWQFMSEDVRGYIAGGGEHGVQIGVTADGKPGTRDRCLNLEHYYSRSGEDGRFVPRYKAPVHSEKIAEDTVRVQIQPYENWRLQATIDFQLLPGPVIAARYAFQFQASFRGFEAFISNYFHTGDEPFLHLNGQWQQPKLTDREHRFWARDAAAVGNIQALYLPVVTPGVEIEMPIDPAYYDSPVMVSPIAGSAQSIVNIVEREHCPSFSANRRWNAHDFSLIARDVAADETIVCRAWLCCTKLAALDDALRLAEKLTAT